MPTRPKPATTTRCRVVASREAFGWVSAVAVEGRAIVSSSLSIRDAQPTGRARRRQPPAGRTGSRRQLELDARVLAVLLADLEQVRPLQLHALRHPRVGDLLDAGVEQGHHVIVELA